MSRRATTAAVVDALAVVAFAALGRRNHDEAGSVLGTFTTATPFLIALAVGWAAPLFRRRPTAPTTGLLLAVGTIVGGMALRSAVFGRGTATPFVVVATAFIVASLVGWRLVAGRAQSSGDLSAR